MNKTALCPTTMAEAEEKSGVKDPVGASPSRANILNLKIAFYGLPKINRAVLCLNVVSRFSPEEILLVLKAGRLVNGKRVYVREILNKAFMLLDRQGFTNGFVRRNLAQAIDVSESRR